VIVISVHVPKCAGDALRLALENAVGRANICYDYEESPFNPTKPVNTDPNYFSRFHAGSYDFLNGKRLVHGHFHISKYKALAPATRIVVLREPVERLISHYFFWKHHPRKNHPLHDYMLDANLSLEEFAEIPSVRRFYSGVFFKNVDMETFDAIGKFSEIPAFLSAFQHLNGLTLTLPVANANPESNYSALKKDLLNDTKRMNHLHSLFSEDTEFYQRWAGKGC